LLHLHTIPLFVYSDDLTIQEEERKSSVPTTGIENVWNKINDPRRRRKKYVYSTLSGANLLESDRWEFWQGNGRIILKQFLRKKK
jgi:hypothetical protein